MEQKEWKQDIIKFGNYAGGHENNENNERERWHRFEKSGAITDYLSYTACTEEMY